MSSSPGRAPWCPWAGGAEARTGRALPKSGLGCPGRSIPAPPAAPGVAEFKQLTARSPAALGTWFISSTSLRCQKGPLGCRLLSSPSGSRALISSCLPPGDEGALRGCRQSLPDMPDVKTPPHLCQDESNSQAVPAGTWWHVRWRKKVVFCLGGWALHAVPLQDGPSTGSDMGLDTWDLRLRLMERDRSGRATCEHVRVHGGARLGELAGP